MMHKIVSFVLLFISSGGNPPLVNTGGAGSAATSVGTFGSSPNANGLSLSSNVLTMQPADGTHPGGVSIAAQTIAGVKTFSSAPVMSGASITSGTIPNASLVNGAVANLSGTNSGDVTLTAIGSSPTANGASLSGQALTLQPADGTHGGVIAASGAQTLGATLTLTHDLTTNSHLQFTAGSTGIDFQAATAQIIFPGSTTSAFIMQNRNNGHTYVTIDTNNDEMVFGFRNAYAPATGLSAAANDAQSGCTALTKEVNVFSTVGVSTNSTCLPTPIYAGEHVYIVNNGANTLHVFPASSNSINSGTNNAEWLTGLAATAAGVLGALDCYSTSTTNWACK